MHPRRQELPRHIEVILVGLQVLDAVGEGLRARLLFYLRYRLLEVLKVERHKIVLEVRALGNHWPILVCERVFDAECLGKIEIGIGPAEEN